MILASRFPPAEQAFVAHVKGLLDSLMYRCDHFEAAIYLMEFSNGPNVPDWRIGGSQLVARHWPFLAANAASTAVYLMHEDMEMLQNNLNKCPTLGALLDVEKNRAAWAAFNRHFPGFDGLRNSAQHGATLYGSPEGVAKHGVNGDVFAGNLFEDSFESVFKGQRVAMRLNRETLAKLYEVRNLMWESFREAARNNTPKPFPPAAPRQPRGRTGHRGR